MAVKKGVCAAGKGSIVGPLASLALTAGEVGALLIKLQALNGELAAATFRTDIADAAPQVVGLTVDLLEDVAFMEWVKKFVCFPAGTLVVVVDEHGECSTKAIETIQVGERVLAREEYGTAIRPQRVLRTLQRTKDALWHIAYRRENDDAEHTIRATGEHPFWSVNRRAWVDAERLEAGDVLTDPRGGTWTVAITRCERLPAPIAVYNLTVEEDHTYFVAPPDAPTAVVLVHNAKCGSFQLPKTWRSAKGVSGKFSDGKHSYRIDTHNLSPGERFHVHIYDQSGNEIAVIQGEGTNGIWRASHRGEVLKRPTEVPAWLRADIRRLLRAALREL